MHTNYMVLGEGKSGTTALYTSLDNNIGEPKVNFFEPPDLTPVAEAIGSANVVAKVLVEKVKGDQVEIVERFDKILMIIRDPRDTLVSRLLYRVRDMDFIHDEAKVERFVSALREKEADATSWSLIGLYELFAEVSGITDHLERYARLHHKTVDMSVRLSGRAHVLLYEDFVAGQTAGADAYVGFPLTSQVEVDAKYRRVTRTKSSGDWRNWFTAEDDAYAKDMYGRYMEHFGYDDWSRSEPPYIDPANSSEYVQSIIQMKLDKTG